MFWINRTKRDFSLLLICVNSVNPPLLVTSGTDSVEETRHTQWARITIKERIGKRDWFYVCFCLG